MEVSGRYRRVRVQTDSTANDDPQKERRRRGGSSMRFELVCNCLLFYASIRFRPRD